MADELDTLPEDPRDLENRLQREEIATLSRLCSAYRVKLEAQETLNTSERHTDSLYRKINESGTLSGVTKNLKDALLQRDIDVELTILRRVVGPHNCADLVHVLESEGAYAKQKDHYFETGKSLSGKAFLTGRSVYTPAAKAENMIFLPGGVSGDASEFAYPLFPVQEILKIARPGPIGVIYLRKEGLDSIPDIDRSKIREVIGDLSGALTKQIEGYDGFFDSKFRQVLAPNPGLDIIKHQYNKSCEEEIPFTLAFVDIDNFKEINNKYLWDTADKILFAFTHFLRDSFRPYDPIVRFGGDEFLIGMKNSSPEQVKSRLLNMKESMKMDNTYCKGLPEDLNVTFSAAVIDNPTVDTRREGGSDIFSYDQLKRTADRALMKSKQGVKNSVVIYHTSELMNGA